jgi:23S rRNA (guanosine2251-2'-O)-methyltransferase
MAHDRTTGTRTPRKSDDARLAVYGANPVLELLRSGSSCLRLLVGKGPREAEILAAARAAGIGAETADRTTLDRLAGSPHHQGTVALVPPFQYVPLERLAEQGGPGLLVLDGVQDPRNLGAILRTARATGAGGVVLPRDRSVGITPVVVAASAGTLFGLPIARVPNLVRALLDLKGSGCWPVALVPRGGSDLCAFTPPPRPVLVAGGEGEGLRQLVQRTCDFMVSIPTVGRVESLNVSVAVGIALFELLVRATRS